MQVHEKLTVTGFITKYGYLGGRTLGQIERLLGFHPGRLARGAVFARLDRLPTINEVETAGYSQVAGHRHRPPADLDLRGLRRLAMSEWSMSGPGRLIKVLPETRHDPAIPNDVQYPPGLGIPQWKLIAPVSATVVAMLQRSTDFFRLV